jgi:hypothetical protein
MGRRINDPSIPASETLTLRLSAVDRDLLDRLVALRASELAGEGVEVTAASYVRGLIRRDAKTRGVEPMAPAGVKPSAPEAGTKPRAPAAKPRPKRR